MSPPFDKELLQLAYTQLGIQPKCYQTRSKKYSPSLSR